MVSDRPQRAAKAIALSTMNNIIEDHRNNSDFDDEPVQRRSSRSRRRSGHAYVESDNDADEQAVEETPQIRRRSRRSQELRAELQNLS